MKPMKLKDIVEIVGIAAIVVPLIFVGLEIRQSAAATRGATQQGLADAAREASGAKGILRQRIGLVGKPVSAVLRQCRELHSSGMIADSTSTSHFGISLKRK
jgi:hypothetical protein